MISHKYKCIFVHIQRTAGTSIEKWICNKNWWTAEPQAKHLTASQAKKVYAEYWDSYFKFSFVRNPWDRTVSMLKYSKHFSLYRKKKFLSHQLCIDGYKEKYGYPILVEHDHRFNEYKNIRSEKHQKNCVYLNILDEQLDFVGKFESLIEDAAHIQKKIGIVDPFPSHKRINQSRIRQCYQKYYNQNTQSIVEDLYRKDIDTFGYTF